MERFEGNGAECMVKFLADGGRGRIEAPGGEPRMTKIVWDLQKNSTINMNIEWLGLRCIYTLPPPVWRIVPQPEAYADCLADIQVQAQHASEPEEWYNVDLCDNLWKTRDIYRFRVREDR